MPGPTNINGITNDKQITSKLSFKVGQQFFAKVIKSSDDDDILLKLTDGWQFNGKVLGNKPSNGDVLRFKVDSYENGSLQLLVIKDESKDKNQIRLQGDSFPENVTAEDAALYKDMVKHSIPLTKENISNIKTILDFKNRALLNKEDGFIDKFLQSKDIDLTSQEAAESKNVLKGFMSEVKDLSHEEILTLMENDIDFNEKNIKSFLKLLNKPDTIYKELMDTNHFTKEEGYLNLLNDLGKDAKVIRKEIDSKIEELTTIISNLLTQKEQALRDNPGSINRLMENINDFKVYNSLSANYYYLGVPLKFNNQEYGLKLIIKDDRKSGKGIDSKDIKLITSISTKNMGVVDAYISLKEGVMRVDLKALEQWVQSLNQGKDELKELLQKFGYNPQITYSIKQKEADIVSCRSFFEDNTIQNLNVLV
ncbi:MAG TPA: hypothetical protein VIK72_09845 [Clostridiaceae bacterium]